MYTHGYNVRMCRAVGAHQVVQDCDGEIKHAHLDGLSERPVEAEQGLGFHAARGTHHASDAWQTYSDKTM